MRRLRRILAVTATAAWLVQATAVPTQAATTSIDLTASASLVAYEEPVTLSGTLTSADASCVDGRTLALEWAPEGSAAFATVTQGQAEADGAFAFTATEPSSGGYRVSAVTGATCDAVASSVVPVQVRALVALVAGASSVDAGSCVDLTATVTPPRPGQVVDLERHTRDGWSPLQRLTLDTASSAASRSCFGWADVGRVRLRARWPAQDDLNVAASSPTLALPVTEAPWMHRIDVLVGDRSVSVAVGLDDTFLYERSPTTPRTPASNEKLLLSMALLDRFGPGFRITTEAATATPVEGGVLRGDLWILGHGDPEVDRSTMAALAREIADRGVERITGAVRGATSYFRRDWDAPGWNDVARDYVARPTALTFDDNLADGRSVPDPERRAAAALTAALEARGIAVKGRPDAGPAPAGLDSIAAVRSRPLRVLLARMLRPSDNFYAEVLGKRLGVATAGAPGTIAKGAAAIRSFVGRQGVTFTLYDNSGLSYGNRVTADGIVRLLWAADGTTWEPTLFRALPTGGQGTLRDRLANVKVKAKTGTLTDISALSGWVWLDGPGAWAEFSILSSGLPKWTASEMEDRIVRLLADQAA